MRVDRNRRLAALEARPAATPNMTEGDKAVAAALYGLLVTHGHLVDPEVSCLGGGSTHAITSEMTPQEAAVAYANTLSVDTDRLSSRMTVGEQAAMYVDFVEAVGRIDPEAEAEFYRLLDRYADEDQSIIPARRRG